MKIKNILNYLKNILLIRNFSFIKLQLITPAEIEKLKSYGVNIQYLNNNYQTHSDQDAKNNLPDFQVEIIRDKKISSFCLFCGKQIYSDQSLPLMEVGFDLPVFYRFHCCAEFFLIIARSPSKRQGIFIPKKNLAISFEEYTQVPHNHEYYSKRVFFNWIDKIQKMIKSNSKLYTTYCKKNKDKKILLLIGFLENFGHHLPDELGGAFQIKEHNYDLPLVYLGPNNWFGFHELFKEFSIINGPVNRNRIKEDLFTLILQENYFALRATAISDIPEKFAEQMIKNTQSSCRPEIISEIAFAEKKWPLIWITLRSSVRFWENEVEELPLVINSLFPDFPDMAVVFDGAKNELENFTKICSGLKKEIPVFSALNCTISETIQWVNKIDFFIAPLGKGSIFTTLTNKPGLFHTHSEWCKEDGAKMVPTRRENAVQCTIISGKISGGKDGFTYNYQIAADKILPILKREIGCLERRVIIPDS